MQHDKRFFTHDLNTNVSEIKLNYNTHIVRMIQGFIKTGKS